jgi:hypothetical protein
VKVVNFEQSGARRVLTIGFKVDPLAFPVFSESGRSFRTAIAISGAKDQ